MQTRTPTNRTGWSFALLLGLGTLVTAGEWPEWGGSPERNMVSPETHLPTEFVLPDRGAPPVPDESDGFVVWEVPLGTQSYGNPVVADGLVFVGTNNGHPRDSRYPGDRGVLMCLRASDGTMPWELVVPKISRTDLFNGDRAQIGICSSPVVEGNRLYVVSNRGEVLCLDTHGMYNGNNGPFLAEDQFLAAPLIHRLQAGKDGPLVEFQAGTPVTPDRKDADILWRFDMIAAVNTWPQDACSSSPLIVGNAVFVGTSNGICDSNRRHALYPNAPSLIALDKHTGQLLAVDREAIGGRTWHGQWSSSSAGVVNGQPLVFYGGGDGVCYAFAAEVGPQPSGRFAYLRKVWSYDCNPAELKLANGEPIRYKTPGDGPSEIIATPVFHDGHVYVAVGQDPTHGPGKGCLSCIDASGKGDITETGRCWSYLGIGRSISTVAVADGRVYAADYSGRLHCLSAATGAPLWVHDTKAHIWGSPLVADGKVYIGTDRGDLWVFAAADTEQVLGRVHLHHPIYSTPVAADGVLYIACHDRLYAVKAKGTGAHDQFAENDSSPYRATYTP